MNLSDVPTISMYIPDIVLECKTASGTKSLVLRNGKSVCTDQDLCLKFSRIPEKNGERWQVFCETKENLSIAKLALRFIHGFQSEERLFLNGYQSWTDSMEFPRSHTMKDPSHILRPLLKKHQLDRYGDYTFIPYSRKKGMLHGFSYAYIRQPDNWAILFASLNEANGFTIFNVNTKTGLFEIHKDLEGVNYKQAEEPYKGKPLIDLFVQEGELPDVFDSYFAALSRPILPAKPCVGWTSWYNYYQNISQSVIMDNLNAFKKHKLPIDIFQIDDGYQTAVGDWLSIQGLFPNGMKFLADEIRATGYTPGIWLAPLVCETKSKIFHEHPDWLMKNQNGAIISCGGNWSGFYTLDFYKQEVRDYLKEVFATVLDLWGFELVKLDFLYAACIEPVYGKSRGELMEDAMLLLRELVGTKKILGCGVPLWQAFGRVEYCRIGPDIDLQWDNKLYRMVAHRERPSTLTALQNTIGRHHLDGRAFINDPDVFLLRSGNIKLDKQEKFTLLLANVTLGNVLFTSDNLQEYDDAQWKLWLSVFPNKEKRVSKIQQRGKVTEVLFSIGGRNFAAYFNLTNNPHDIRIDTACFTRNADACFWVEPSRLELPPHGSICLSFPDQEEVGILGSTCSLYPGTETEFFEYTIKETELNLHLVLNKQVLAGGSLFIRIPRETQTVLINDTAYKPEKPDWYTGPGQLVEYKFTSEIV